MSSMGVAARSVSEEFSSGCEGRSGSGGGSTGAPADQDHRPDHGKQHRDKTPDDRDEGKLHSCVRAMSKVTNSIEHFKHRGLKTYSCMFML